MSLPHPISLGGRPCKAPASFPRQGLSQGGPTRRSPGDPPRGTAGTGSRWEITDYQPGC